MLAIWSNDYWAIPSIPFTVGFATLRCPLITSIPSPLPRLIDLDCSGCISLLCIALFPQLKVLICSGCSSLISIASLPELKNLECMDCTSLVSIASQPKLNKLSWNTHLDPWIRVVMATLSAPNLPRCLVFLRRHMRVGVRIRRIRHYVCDVSFLSLGRKKHSNT